MASTASIPQNFVPTLPSLKDLLDRFRTDLLINLNCHHIGTVQSFNTINQTATATINYQKTLFTLDEKTQQYSPTQVSYPILVDCPVIILGGGICSLTFPIQKGDECIILFNDRDMDNWFAGSTTAGVATPRLHSFSDGMILVGVRNLNNILTSYDTNRAVLQNGTTLVGVGPELIKIANDAFTLKTLLQTLCTDIENLISALTTNAATFIAVTGSPGSPSPLNPVIVTALSSVSSSLSTLSTEIGELLE